MQQHTSIKNEFFQADLHHQSLHFATCAATSPHFLSLSVAWPRHKKCARKGRSEDIDFGLFATSHWPRRHRYHAARIVSIFLCFTIPWHGGAIKSAASHSRPPFSAMHYFSPLRARRGIIPAQLLGQHARSAAMMQIAISAERQPKDDYMLLRAPLHRLASGSSRSRNAFPRRETPYRARNTATAVSYGTPCDISPC